MVLRNNSKLGEEVYLTEEDLAEMKLYGCMVWYINYPIWPKIVQPREAINILYNTTNLLQVVSDEYVKTWREESALSFFYCASRRNNRRIANSLDDLLNDRERDGLFVSPIVAIDLETSWNLYSGEVFYLIPE